MPYYAGLKRIKDAVVRRRTIEGVQRLRAALLEAIPTRTATDTLLLATWNIREFDAGKYGYRADEPYYYIAEILSRFDLIAIQEVRDGLYPLQYLRRLLGDDWSFLVTDVTLGASGNAERMGAFATEAPALRTQPGSAPSAPRCGCAESASCPYPSCPSSS